MDERDFLKALSDGRFPSKEAHEYFSELRKTAGVKDMALKGAKEVGKAVSERKIPLMAALIGGAAAVALQYKQNKPQGDKPSKERQSAESSLAAHDKADQEATSQGKPRSFIDQLNHSRARASADVSKVTEKHPARGALLAAPAGAAVGYGLGALGHRLLG